MWLFSVLNLSLAKFAVFIVCHNLFIFNIKQNHYTAEFKKKVTDYVEEMVNLALYGTEDDALWEDSDKGLSDDDLGHPGPSDGQ
jgi:hypothetical protein